MSGLSLTVVHVVHYLAKNLNEVCVVLQRKVNKKQEDSAMLE